MRLYKTDYVMIESKEETTVRIFAENDLYQNKLIGYFDFYNMDGWYYDLNGKQKEVQRFSTIMNYLFKQNDMLGWDDSLVEKAKQNAKQMRITESKKRKLELKEADENKAFEMLEGIKQHQEKYIRICESVKNKSDEELNQLVERTFKNASNKTIEAVFNAIQKYNSDEIEVTQEVTEVASIIEMSTKDTETTSSNDNEPEVFYLRNNTFNTYSKAFTHAVQNQMATTMILSSKHPTMTNERLQQLEHSFIFDKTNMSHEDKKYYFNYLESIPNSLDRENRYYKLKSWIDRYEVQQQRQQEEKQRIQNLGLEASKTLDYMVANGLEIKENESYVKYYLNGQDVHTWFSGISADKYHEGIMNLYNNYFKKVSL